MINIYVIVRDYIHIIIPILLSCAISAFVYFAVSIGRFVDVIKRLFSNSTSDDVEKSVQRFFDHFGVQNSIIVQLFATLFTFIISTGLFLTVSSTVDGYIQRASAMLGIKSSEELAYDGAKECMREKCNKIEFDNCVSMLIQPFPRSTYYIQLINEAPKILEASVESSACKRRVSSANIQIEASKTTRSDAEKCLMQDGCNAMACVSAFIKSNNFKLNELTQLFDVARSRINATACSIDTDFRDEQLVTNYPECGFVLNDLSTYKIDYKLGVQIAYIVGD